MERQWKNIYVLQLLISTLSQLVEMIHTDITEPIEKDVEKYNEIYSVYASLYGCLKDKFNGLCELNL